MSRRSRAGSSIKEGSPESNDGYRWTALSVTTVGVLLASMQVSALLIALPNILTAGHDGSDACDWASCRHMGS